MYVLNFAGGKAGSAESRKRAAEAAAAVATSSMDEGGSSWNVGNMAANMWQQLANSLMGLEAKLQNQASATSKQYAKLDKLKAKVGWHTRREWPRPSLQCKLEDVHM